MSESKEVISTTTLAMIGEPSAALIAVAMKMEPRDLIKFEKDVISVVQSSPEIAESCIYFRPVGKDKKKRQTFASGISIRLAEIGHQAYGRLFVKGVVEEIDNTVVATVGAFDLGTLNITYGRCSKSIIGQYGKFPAHVIETMKSAVSSIARREALSQQMRPQLTRAMFEARKIAIKQWSADGDHKKAYNAIFNDFEKRWKITPKQLKSIAETETNPEAQLMLLIGIRNYLIDNPDELSSVFGDDKLSPKSGIGQTEEITPEEPKAITPHEAATAAEKEEWKKRQTQGKAPKSEAAGKPVKDDTELPNQPQTAQEPSAIEKFELDVQTMAESAGKNLVFATEELCKAFKVKALSEIDPKEYGAALKHLGEVL
jgi:hypothetical protein